MFHINIDLSALEGLEDIRETLQQAAEEAVQELSAMAMAKVHEIAAQKLHSRRDKYIKALSMREEEGVWIIELDPSANWIEDGQDAHSMVQDLLAGKDKAVIPFEHGPNKGQANVSPSQFDLVSTVKSEFKKQGIPWSKIERDDQGRPKLGTLHRMNIRSKPFKTAEGPGQGWGPVGDVKQGYSESNARAREHGGPTKGGGIPFLQGVAVIQKANDEGKVTRSIMTFRTVVPEHEAEGRWFMPDMEGVNIFPEVYEWAEKTLEDVIMPELLKKIS